jgi:hypothetical protein
VRPPFLMRDHLPPRIIQQRRLSLATDQSLGRVLDDPRDVDLRIDARLSDSAHFLVQDFGSLREDIEVRYALQLFQQVGNVPGLDRWTVGWLGKLLW